MFQMLSLSNSIAFGVFVIAVVAAIQAWRLRRARAAWQAERQEQRAARVEHLLRLASEIAAVSLSIEDDLAPFRSIPTLARLQTRARRMRARADTVRTGRERLRDLPGFELDAQVAEMHTDHLRMVALRAHADAEIRDWRKHVRRGIEAAKSTWPFVTTPLSSNFDA